jgi:clan AA aspartic protease
MKGHVDGSGRAILAVGLKAGSQKVPHEIDVWIDTGFTGDLVVPRIIVDRLALQQTGTIDGILADGTQVLLETFHCEIEWFGMHRGLELIANDGEMPLLGIGLLLAKELRIDYTNLTLSLVPAPKRSS